MHRRFQAARAGSVTGGSRVSQACMRVAVEWPSGTVPEEPVKNYTQFKARFPSPRNDQAQCWVRFK